METILYLFSDQKEMSFDGRQLFGTGLSTLKMNVWNHKLFTLGPGGYLIGLTAKKDVTVFCYKL